MNKKIDFKDNEKYSCDSVINQGYAIYDEWTAKKLSSRKIVNSVNDAVSAVEKKNTITARLIVLSYLFALDTRVKERYNTILRCIIFYFSWKREIKTLKMLNVMLNLVNTNDLRDAIELELQRLRDEVDYEASDDGDDDVRGGKRNGKVTDEVVSNNQRQQNNAKNEKNGEISEGENTDEYSEEEIDNIDEQNITDEQLEKVDPKKEDMPAVREEKEVAVTNDTDKSEQTAIDQLKEENNGLVERSEQNIDNRTTDINNYIEPVAQIFDFEESERHAESTDVIDEIIVENNSVENKKDVNPNSLNNSIIDDRAQENQNAEVEQNQEDNTPEKNDYLYDNILNNSKDTDAKPIDELSQIKTDTAKLQSKEQLKTQAKEQLKGQSKEQSKEQLKTHLREKTNEHSKEQLRERLNNKSKNQSQSKTTTQSIKNDFKKLRVPIKIDLGNAKGNEARQSVNQNISKEPIETVKTSQINENREQLNIASNELGIDSKNKIIEKNEPLEIKQSKVELNKK